MRLPPSIRLGFALVAVLFVASRAESSFANARAHFHTKLVRHEKIGLAPETPPPTELELVSYPAPLGDNAAYVSPNPHDGRKHPAIVWLVGGFSSSIGSVAWERGPRSNDQSAAGFRDDGIVMLYPSLRGGNQNPGEIETFCGEIDDVIAAAKYVASLDYVDPGRVFLGGHSTGGTLALLVAEASGTRFRAVFALGPVGDVAGYGSDVLPFDLRNRQELMIRAPQLWLKDIQVPVFVFEGENAPSNIGSLRALKKRCSNPLVRFIPLPGETHFSAIEPTVFRLADAIAQDDQPGKPFALAWPAPGKPSE